MITSILKVSLAMIFAATLLLSTATQVSADEVFRCTDRDGRVFYQGQACGTAPAGGAMLYKCQNPKGAVSIQSAPCAEKSKTVWARPAEPEYETVESRRRQQALLRKQSVDARALSRLAGTDRSSANYGGWSGPNEHEQKLARCNAAKRDRENILNQIGLKRTYELLQELDRQVAVACRGL